MFSVPKPLPPAGGDAAAVSRHLSPTATTPYPTHQTITTPESSRAIGDWGFKRALPVHKTIKSSTPAVRIRQIDSIEKVTDYRSASDHTITLQKFQEMNLPLSLPATNRARVGGLNNAPKSVFEDEGDFTTLEPGRPEENRWKFKGPWLAGLTKGQFDKYMRKNVRSKREEFRSFLKKRNAEQMNAAALQKALDQGHEPPTPLTAEDITDEQLIEYQRRLRSDRVTLFSLVSEFLDLAPLQPPSFFKDRIDTAKRPSVYAENGPPMSHPSAGISYLRTAAFAENHPVYGPQAHQTPVLARIVQPRSTQQTAKLGVGGFITEVPLGDTAFNARAFAGGKTTIPGIQSFDPDIEGGAKSFVQPQYARVDSSGSIQITVGEADTEAQLIYKELVGKADIYNSGASRSEAKRSNMTPLAQVQSRKSFRSPYRNAEGNKVVGDRQPARNKRPSESSQGYGLDLS
ncbi:hypothetical protein CkaCkLH20_00861 [Colletotrichum karsti]|uniref:Meiotically up-regulated gene 178 protein n=1 Tax=Colletotrichum karsti TaxID=1095194 RepID=A0A9P6LQ39_9PEZI|nr:uncharacterized protein CkaCkLH20_00861 [Colletotrichum karsti]KAF9881715.1 hypothetical protein CkaCkLH20_00861 [Colletotrichum karsti]